jgi:hypothetical protein
MSNEVVPTHKYQLGVGVEDTNAMQKSTQQAAATRQKCDSSEAEINLSLSAEHQHRHRRAHKNDLAPSSTSTASSSSSSTKSRTNMTSRTNSLALEMISEFDEDQSEPQGFEDWAHEASMNYGMYETMKNFVLAMIESESDHNSSSGSKVASDDVMEVEPVHRYV